MLAEIRSRPCLLLYSDRTWLESDSNVTCPSESVLQAFAEGNLEPSERLAVCEHLDTCDECQLLVGAVAPSLKSRAAENDERTDAPPTHIGRYWVRKTIGQGGMGTVYEAFDPELERVVAIKVLRTNLNSSSLEARLRKEALAMAKLSHAHVVPVHDVGHDSARTFVVMALVRGASLRTWLLSEPRSLEMVCSMFVQAAQGLAAAHEALSETDDDRDGMIAAGAPRKTFVQAATQIVVADVSMSLDNVLAVAGAAREHPTVLVIGLILSIALMGVAANYIARLLGRYPWIAYIGLAIILYVAFDMIYRGVLELWPVVGG